MARSRKDTGRIKVSSKMVPRGGSYQATLSWTPEPGNNRRERRNFATEADAEKWVLESTLLIKQGLDIEKGDRAVNDGKPRTVEQIGKYVYDHYWSKQSGGEKQYANFTEVAEIIGRSKQIAKIDNFTTNSIVKFLEAKGNSGATVNRKLAALRRCLSEAVVLGVLTARPTWKKQKESSGRIARIGRDLEVRMLNWCDRMSLPDIHDFVLWSVHLGTRNGETLKITYADIHTDKVVLPGVITKNGQPRSIPLPPVAVEMLARRRATAINPKERIFAGLTKRSFDVQWAKMREHLGLDDDPDFVPHAMRHEFCSRLAERGASASYIQALSGHLTLAVCQRYVHLFGAETVEMARRFMQDAAQAADSVENNVVAMADRKPSKGLGVA